MEKLQNQLNVLNDKVDVLHQLVEQMSCQLNALLAGQTSDGVTPVPGNTPLSSSLRPNSSASIPAITPNKSSSGHKDVLEDGQNLERLLDYNTKERSLSPDLQIRRLTAQVTAAYNRIAALEEQLLARRSNREEKKLIRTLPEQT